MKIIQPICLILALTTLLFFATQPIGFSINIPQQISYQGKLMENGVPVNGTKTFTFAFVDTDWHEIHENVRVVNGIYSVVLGSITEIPPQIFENNTQTKMNITVDDIELAPDVDILSVGYAFVAHKAEYAEVANRVSNAIYVNESMSVGIGTDEPTQMLDVRGGIRIGYTEKGSAGSIRYTNTNIEFHDGEKWGAMNNNSQWTDDDKGIHYDHNVGIGATNVESKLQVTNLDETKASFLIQQKITPYFLKNIDIDKYDDVVDIVKTSDNQFIIIGNIGFFKDQEIIVMKFDEIGRYLWGKSIGTKYKDECSSICETSDGGFIIVGISYYIEDVYGNNDVLAFKINESGSILWANLLGQEKRDYANCVIESYITNNIIIFGTTQFENSTSDIFICELEQDGNLKKYKTISWQGFRVGGVNIKKASDGGYIACAETWDIACAETCPGSGLFKLTTSLNLDWIRSIGETGEQTIFIDEYNNDSYILGTRKNSKLLLLNISKSGIIHSKTGIYKSGSLVFNWGKEGIGDSHYYLKSFYKLSNGSFILSGTSWSEGKGTNAQIMKINQFAEFEWLKTYQTYEPNAIIGTNEGFMFVGKTSSSGERDFVVALIDKNGEIPGSSIYQDVTNQFETIDVDSIEIQENDFSVNEISPYSINFQSIDLQVSNLTPKISTIAESSATTTSTSPVKDVFVAAANGNIGIGLNNPQYQLHVNGYAYNIGSWGSSDKRWKTNLSPLNNSLKKITLLNGYSFNWDTANYPEMNFPTEPQIGLIAQEVEKIFPKLVHTDDEGYKAVAYDKLTAVLVEALKELNNKNETLSSEIEALKNEIEILKGKF
jgi:hypothetical protein